MSHAEDYRPDIDGLRALAVVLVVVFHVSPDFLPGGYRGVDVFFVISGYLITSIILREIRAGIFTLRSFYARRCRRILPALVVVLAATWLIGHAALIDSDVQIVGKHIFGGATFTSNMLLWRETGYFDLAAVRKPLLHLWSLGVEEQFYLVWPPLTLLAVVKGWRPLGLSALLLTGSLALAIGLAPAHAEATFYWLPTRMWELLVGAVLVQMEGRTDTAAPRSTSSRAWRDVRAVVGVLLIAAVCFLDPGSGRTPIGWLMAPVVGTALVISARGAWVNRHLLSLRAVVLIGLISYPLYLWHWPLLSVVTLLAGQTTMQQLTLLKGGAVALAFVLAALTWWGVERPVRRLATAMTARPRRNEQVLGCSACVLIALSVLGWRTWDRGHVPEVDTIAADEPLLDSAAVFPNAKGYHRVSASNDVVALLGDSHASHLLPGLVPEALKRGFGVSHVGFAGCPGVPLRVRLWGSLKMFHDCQAIVDATLAHFLADPAVKIVVFAARGGLYSVGTDSGHAGGNADVQVPGELRLQTLYEGYSSAMTRVERSGKRFLLVLDIPELDRDFEPHYCITRLAPATRLRQCAIARATVDERQRDYRGVVAQLQRAHPQLTVFDPLPLLCDSRWCNVTRNGLILYRDPTHLSGDGSILVATALAKTLFQP